MIEFIVDWSLSLTSQELLSHSLFLVATIWAFSQLP